MVSGWRLAFCTTVPKDTDHTTTTTTTTTHDNLPAIQSTSRFGFFSSSTPNLHRLRCRTASATAPVSQSSSLANSPKLSCKTNPHRSCPTSPPSSSSFSLLKTTLRLSRQQQRCGVCLQSIKAGQGSAIFTAECSHVFHFPCVVELVKKHNPLLCPVCNASWKELPLLDNHKADNLKSKKQSDLKIYNDDEPLMSPTAGVTFNPIPESDYEDDDHETSSSLIQDSFQGFFTTSPGADYKNVGVSFLPEAAVVSAGQGYETYAVVMEVQAPPMITKPNGKASSFRAPVDLVAVIDVSNNNSVSGSNLQTMKRAMRVLISSLSSNDRLSIVAFSACSKRLLPLRRMTVDGRRTARRIIDVISTRGQGMSAGDAVRKAAKVLEDRRIKNPVATVIVLSNKCSTNLSRQIYSVQTTRLPQLNIPVHSFGFESSLACNSAASIDEVFVKTVQKLLCVPVHDLRLQFGSVHDSVEVKGVYTCTGRTKWLGSGTGLIKLGDFHAEEKREILMELRTKRGAHSAISVRSSYTDPLSQQMVHVRGQTVTLPNPNKDLSSSTWHRIERLRCMFISARAVAESKRAAERNDLSGAHHLLSSARALLIQSKSASAGDFVRRVEAELGEVKWRREQAKMEWEKAIGRSLEVKKEETLTPTSAWRTAERLAKMRKSLNRVSDLHGFENARF